MSAYTVWIVAPAGDLHWQCLTEAAAGIAHSLRSLGHDVRFHPGDGPYDHDPFGGNNIHGRLIVFNAHRLSGMQLPADAIIFNAEQVPESDADLPVGWLNYLGILRRHIVWEYSATNIERLRKHDANKVVQCPIGYWAGLSNIQPAAVEDLDVLFVGSINERRSKILNEIVRRGLSLQVLTGVYGSDRNRWIARAKVAVNLHFYPRPIFEIFRVSHLLANKKCIVSEDGGTDPQLEAFAGDSTSLVKYEEIPDVAVALVKDHVRRRVVADHGFDVFSQRLQQDFVKLALEQL